MTSAPVHNRTGAKITLFHSFLKAAEAIAAGNIIGIILSRLRVCFAEEFYHTTLDKKRQAFVYEKHPHKAKNTPVRNEPGCNA